MKKILSQKRGVTLVELMIITSIIGVVFFLSTTMIRFMNSVSKEKLTYESQRDVEIWLYQMARDVRDAQQIWQISATSMTLKVYDLTKGYDVNTSGNDFYNPTKVQTLNYSFLTDAKGTYLDRQLLDKNNVVIDEKKLLRNVLEPDDPTTAGYDHIFTPVPETSTSTFNAVQIDLRVHPKGFDVPARIYRAQSMMRRTSDS